MFDISNKNAFITGAVSGIGLAIAKRFIAAGANVMIADLKDDAGIAEEINAHFVACDVTNEQQVAEALAYTETTLGKLDIVVNNAGVGATENPCEDADMDQFQFVLDVNVKGVVHGMKYAPRHMNDGGAIINMASMAAFHGMPGSPAYHASKAAVMSLTQVGAMELGRRRIRVTAVCPTVVSTPMIVGTPLESTLQLAAVISPLQATPTAEDIAGVCHFLASNEAKFITGSAIAVDGGGFQGLSYQALYKLMS